MRSTGDVHVTRWGDGQRAVLVHGSFGWGESTWQEQWPLSTSYELLVIDRRGFGLTPANGRVDFDRDADDVAALAEGAHLVGHSYGGVVSLLAAARTPVRSLTVIEPPALGLVRGDPIVEDFVSRIEEAVRAARDPSDYRYRFLLGFGFDADPEELSGADLVAATSSHTERQPWEAEVPLDRLAVANVRTLVVRGAWDEADTAARNRAGRVFHMVCDLLAERLEAQTAVFPGAAHSPQLLGAPFNDRLLAFWQGA